MTTKGYRVEVGGFVAYVSDENAGKARGQCIRALRDGGWKLPSNPFNAVAGCRRWPDGDGLAPTCHRLNCLDDGVETEVCP